MISCDLAAGSESEGTGSAARALGSRREIIGKVDAVSLNALLSACAGSTPAALTRAYPLGVCDGLCNLPRYPRSDEFGEVVVPEHSFTCFAIDGDTAGRCCAIECAKYDSQRLDFVGADTGILKDGMKIRAGVEAAGLTDVGCQRENNEDHFAFWEPDCEAEFVEKGRLAVVADGMGGYEGGQVASHLAVMQFSTFTKQIIMSPPSASTLPL